jgi:Uma2 family endonuclease
MSIATPAAEKRVLLSNISWSTFMDLARSDRAGARFAYDDGYLEIMPISLRHERIKKRMARMIEGAAVRIEAPIVGAGSTTLKIELKKRGIEPDECYYLAHASALGDVDELDLAIDPPPDLAVEIDISRSSLDQLAIYADMGVPEVWIYDEEAIHVWILQPNGLYREESHSVAFPFLPLGEFLELLLQQPGIEEPEGWRAYENWLRRLNVGS